MFEEKTVGFTRQAVSFCVELFSNVHLIRFDSVITDSNRCYVDAHFRLGISIFADYLGTKNYPYLFWEFTFIQRRLLAFKFTTIKRGLYLLFIYFIRKYPFCIRLARLT